jgi:hypothetical protein
MAVERQRESLLRDIIADAMVKGLSLSVEVPHLLT